MSVWASVGLAVVGRAVGARVGAGVGCAVPEDMIKLVIESDRTNRHPISIHGHQVESISLS